MFDLPNTRADPQETCEIHYNCNRTKGYAARATLAQSQFWSILCVCLNIDDFDCVYDSSETAKQMVLNPRVEDIRLTAAFVERPSNKKIIDDRIVGVGWRR